MRITNGSRNKNITKMVLIRLKGEQKKNYK